MHLFRIFTQFLMDGSEPAAAPVVPAPEPVAVAPAPVPTPAAGDAPWATDLAALGLDETGRSAVDQYLRSTVQPRTTKLEQELAEAAPARELFTDFQDDPEGTFLAIGEQLFEGADPAALRAALGLRAPEAAPAAPAAPLAEDPLLAEIREERAAAARAAAWNDSMAPIREADPKINDRLFAPFVVAAEGDFEAAHTAYKAYNADLLAANGVTAPALPAVVPPPSVLGTGDSPGTIPQPIEPKYASMDEAMDATFAEIAAARAAPAVV